MSDTTSSTEQEVSQGGGGDAAPIDKEFAEWLGKAVQGLVEVKDEALGWFIEQLRLHQKQHGQLSQRIAQAQQELVTARTELTKIEGRIEQGVAAAKRFKEIAEG